MRTAIYKNNLGSDTVSEPTKNQAAVLVPQVYTLLSTKSINQIP